MRLINVKTLKLETFGDENVPPYVILSHTWGPDSEEISFQEIESGNIDKPGLGIVKLRGSCRQAQKDNHNYIWNDTCCIDKTNSVELNEAINSMFRWYSKAAICYAYLSDVPNKNNQDPAENDSRFRRSRWFERGWTLQELLAPQNLVFYSMDWEPLGAKSTPALCAVVESVTGIPSVYLKSLGLFDLRSASVAQRMAWAARRQTRRSEDMAYSLLGIFDISMAMIYGEGGEQAFRRLQIEIMNKTSDHSILAWGLGRNTDTVHDIGNTSTWSTLATSPADFAHSGHIVRQFPGGLPSASPDSIGITSGSLQIRIPVVTLESGEVFGLLNCGPEHRDGQAVAIPLKKATVDSPNEYIRPRHRVSALLPRSDAGPTFIHIKNDTRDEMVLKWCFEYDEDEFSRMSLDLIDVFPRPYWDREKAVIMSSLRLDDDDAPLILARFRYRSPMSPSPDFLTILEFNRQGTYMEAQNHLAICSRDTTTDDLCANLQVLALRALGRKSATNGLLSLRVTLERGIGQSSIFRIKPEEIHQFPPGDTVDVTRELTRSSLALDITRALEIKRQAESEINRLSEQIQTRAIDVRKVKLDLDVMNIRIQELEQQREPLLRIYSQMDAQLEELKLEESGAKTRARRADAQQLSALREWDALHGVSHDPDSWQEKIEDGWTPLIWASFCGDYGIVQQMLKEGADAGCARSDGSTPLMAAAVSGNVEIVRLLLGTGVCDVNARIHQTGWTALGLAVKYGHYDTVSALLESPEVDIDARNTDGQTALMTSALNGDEHIVRMLLEKGADTNIRDNSNFSARRYAIITNHQNIAELLPDATPHYTLRSTMKQHLGIVAGVAFSHDSKLLASASHDHSIMVWDTATDTRRQTLRCHTGWVRYIVFSHDSKLLASCSSDHDIRLWETSTWTCRRTLIGHEAPVRCAAFSARSKRIVSGAEDEEIRLWNTESGLCLLKLLCPGQGHVLSVTFSSDSRLVLFITKDEALSIWDPKNNECHRVLVAEEGTFLSSAFSRGATLLAAGTVKREVKVWKRGGGEVYRPAEISERHNSWIRAAAFSPDGRLLCSSAADRTIKIRDMVHRHCQVITLPGKMDMSFLPVAFSPDMTMLAAGSDDGAVRIWSS
ncbi:hypothetical protein QBC34DRAFT_76996 [Podospora aff. communis PSN243]|uniref:Vegetative incompatibility protein HET-E-1 n=1 Tax=Podospora aff. communis PSN243 TaxID=3040156 RepID=A0AAV9GNI5_9PEZI|nr:hypothetical protein QBC34DRAFT_76996 [Podospora aff. communis PSN243]